CKLGTTLKSAGGQIKQTTKQVTGLGRGSVKLELDQTRVGPGGIVKGRVVLAVSEPVSASKLVVALRARQKVMTVHRTEGGRSVGTSHADVYEFELALGGDKTYTTGESVPFELTVPPDALELRPSSSGANALADAVRTVASALSP